MSSSDKPVVLLVDDTPANLHMLNEALQDQYFIRVSTSGPRALELLHTPPLPDIILLDIMMPGMDGYEVCRRLKDEPLTADIPVIFVSAMSEEHDEALGLDLGAVDYITKPFSLRLLQARLHNHLLFKKQRDHLSELVAERTHELLLTRTATIESLAALAESRDSETGSHIRRTQQYVRLLGDYLRSVSPTMWPFSDEELELLTSTAPLHDIGKVGIPDAILLKPGKLTHEEFEIMKKHTLFGYQTLSRAGDQAKNSTFLTMGAELAYSHHEKWDGSGYPRGLKGTDIPAPGRLMALADTFDALVTRRVYKPPFTFTQASEILTQGKGSHFDPCVIDAFDVLREDFRRIGKELADSEDEREALDI